MHRLKSYNVLALDTGWTAQLLVACVTVCISCSLVYGFGLGFCMEQRVHHDQLRDCLRTRIELVISKDITKSEVQFNSSLESNKTADRGITEDNAAKRKVRRSVSGGPNKGDMTREDCLAYSVERLMEVITHRNPLHHYKRRLDTDKEEDKLETMNSFLKAMAIYSLDINQAIEDCPDTLSPSVKDPLMTEQAGVVTSPQSDRRNVTDMNFTTSSSQEVSMTSATFGSEAAIVDQRQEKYEILSTKTLMSGKTTTVSPTPIARTSKQTHNIKIDKPTSSLIRIFDEVIKKVGEDNNILQTSIASGIKSIKDRKTTAANNRGSLKPEPAKVNISGVVIARTTATVQAVKRVADEKGKARLGVVTTTTAMEQVTDAKRRPGIADVLVRQTAVTTALPRNGASGESKHPSNTSSPVGTHDRIAGEERKIDFTIDIGLRTLRCRLLVEHLHMIIYLIGVILGSVVCLYVYRIFSNLTSRSALHISHGLALFSLIFLLPNDRRIQHRLVIVSRMFHGIAAGFGLVLAPRYLHEISPRGIHSQTVSVHYVFICLGMLFGHFSGGRSRSWIFGTWNYAFPIVMGSLLLPWLPESPVCMVKKGKKEKAHRHLQRLRKCINVQDELDRIEEECKINMIVDPDSTIPMMVRHGADSGGDSTEIIKSSVLLCILSALCGCYMFLSYINQTLYMAGMQGRRIRNAPLIIMFIQLLGSVIGLCVIRTIKRRTLLRLGALTQAACLLLYAMVMQSQMRLNSQLMAQLAVLVMSINVLFFGMSLGPLLFVCTVELVPTRCKMAALSFCVALFHLISLFIMLVFPIFVAALGNMLFVILAIAVALLHSATRSSTMETLDWPGKEDSSPYNKPETPVTLIPEQIPA